VPKNELEPMKRLRGSVCFHESESEVLVSVEWEVKRKMEGTIKYFIF